MTLAAELAHAVRQVRNRGGSMIDCHTLETILARHGAQLSCACQRPDLLAGDQLSRVLAP
jgi:hypothetical protein